MSHYFSDSPNPLFHRHPLLISLSYLCPSLLIQMTKSNLYGQRKVTFSYTVLSFINRLLSIVFNSYMKCAILSLWALVPFVIYTSEIRTDDWRASWKAR